MTSPAVGNLDWKRPKGYETGHCPELATTASGLIAIRSSERPDQIAVFNKQEWLILQQEVRNQTILGKKRGKPAKTPGKPMSSSEVGALIGVTGATIRRWAAKGHIPSRRQPNGQRRYNREAIMKMITEGKL